MNQDKYYKTEHHKISTLLKDSTASKFVTGKWNEVYDLSNGQYSTNNNIDHIGVTTVMHILL